MTVILMALYVERVKCYCFDWATRANEEFEFIISSVVSLHYTYSQDDDHVRQRGALGRWP